jgi:hypothetical protein
MEKLDINARMEIVLKLSPKDLLQYCSINKKANKEVCESDIFWRKKLEKDYPLEMLEVRKKGIDVIKNPKNVYMKRFTSVAYKIEKFIEVFITYNFGEGFINYVTKEYKEKLFDAIHQGYVSIKNYDFSKNPNPEKDIKIDIMVDEISDFFPHPDYEITFEQTSAFFYKILPEFTEEILKETIYDIVK